MFGGSWGSIENLLEPKTEPLSGNFACPNPWNDLYDILQAVVFALMLVAAGNGEGDGDLGDEEDEHTGKIRHGRKLGKYKYKEEVIKRVEFNHPCRYVR